MLTTWSHSHSTNRGLQFSWSSALSNFLVNPRSWVVSAGLIVAGVIFLLGTLNVLDVSYRDTVALFSCSSWAQSYSSAAEEDARGAPRPQNATGAAGTPDLNVSAFFAGGEHRIQRPEFTKRAGLGHIRFGGGGPARRNHRRR